MESKNRTALVLVETSGLDTTPTGRVLRNIEAARASLEVASLQLMTDRMKSARDTFIALEQRGPHRQELEDVIQQDGLRDILSDLSLISRRLAEIQNELELHRRPTCPLR